MPQASNDLNTLQPKLNIKLPSTGNAAADAPAEDSALKSKEELDRDASVIRLEAEKLKLRRELLELEKLTGDIEEARAAKAAKQVTHDMVEDTLKYQTEDRTSHEEACNHRKGGDALQLLGGAPGQGSDGNNYAVIQHTLTSGVIFRMCLRCGRTWFPKDPDYRWAMSLPTKNKPSTGSPSPGLTKHPERVRQVSEIPHRNVVNGVPSHQSSSGPEGY